MFIPKFKSLASIERVLLLRLFCVCCEFPSISFAIAIFQCVQRKHRPDMHLVGFPIAPHELGARFTQHQALAAASSMHFFGNFFLLPLPSATAFEQPADCIVLFCWMHPQTDCLDDDVLTSKSLLLDCHYSVWRVGELASNRVGKRTLIRR